MKNSLLTDVSLKKISFSEDGTSITFDFIDLYKGLPLKSIKCEFVKSFQYQSVLAADDGLPCYIGDVCLFNVPHAEAQSYLSKNGFQFITDFFDDGKVELKFLSIFGGEIELKVICLSVTEK